MFTYELTSDGYLIYRDGQPIIRQTRVPIIEGILPLATVSDAEKVQYAEAEIASLEG